MKIAQCTAIAAVASLLATGLSTVARAADDNPLKNAKVGDWIEFTSRNEAMGQTMEMQMKQSVVAKDETSVTLRTEVTMMGAKMPGKDMKIALDKPYEPYTQDLTDAKVTPLGEGNEKITVAGKTYDCHWTNVKVVATNPQAVEMTTKVWTCKDVPVNGLVRMESAGTMTMAGQAMPTKMTMELKGAGSK